VVADVAFGPVQQMLEGEAHRHHRLEPARLRFVPGRGGYSLSLSRLLWAVTAVLPNEIGRVQPRRGGRQLNPSDRSFESTDVR
jgi:hypothetical protein